MKALASLLHTAVVALVAAAVVLWYVVPFFVCNCDACVAERSPS